MIVGAKENDMSDERRSRERYPSFRMVELIATGGGDEKKSFPIMLRDMANGGLGGVFIGQADLNPEIEYLLREPDGAEKTIQIVWTKQVAENVLMLGFEAVQE